MSSKMTISQHMKPVWEESKNNTMGSKGLDINPTLLKFPPASRFGGADTEDPYKHLDLFEEIYDTFPKRLYPR
jgi:hypothetical protein